MLGVSAQLVLFIRAWAVWEDDLKDWRRMRVRDGPGRQSEKVETKRRVQGAGERRAETKAGRKGQDRETSQNQNRGKANVKKP